MKLIKSLTCGIRFGLFAALIAVGPLVPGGNAAAHHGWEWTSGAPFELSGTIEDIYIGQPHPTLTIRSDGNLWEVDLAPVGATTNAGFVEGVASPGDAVTVYGHRSRNESEYAMKAVRVVVGGGTYDVYPERARAF
ncbi:hypothetical protein [Fodinicurvata sp. EGI_FJ10296]|uniref:hypothetical protein n=1 Tax=Fodinicurvata sp. EGI_FJ10296 TaxID=3231908 RepID=UPI0034561247